MKKYVIGIALILIAGIIVIILPSKPDFDSESSTITTQTEYYYNDNENEDESLLPNDLNSILSDNEAVPLDTNPTSITVLVNRSYLLPATYVPSDLSEPAIAFSFRYTSEKRKLRKEAADALEKLFEAAAKDNVILYGVSGYRSYTRQKQIYENNVRSRGVTATDSVSAKPGSSEHQSGLSIDVSAKSVGCRLDQALGNTAEGKWLAKNAHTFGYIIRYPKGKEAITGYSYEPWHIRYVGKQVATYLYKNNLTLEEYYGTTCDEKNGDSSVTGVDVENADTVTYATPKPTKKPKATKEPKETPEPTKKPKKAESTKKPKATKKPNVAKTPEPTKVPNEPVVTAAPPAPTAAPDTPVETPVPGTGETPIQ